MFIELCLLDALIAGAFTGAPLLTTPSIWHPGVFTSPSRAPCGQIWDRWELWWLWRMEWKGRKAPGGHRELGFGSWGLEIDSQKTFSHPPEEVSVSPRVTVTQIWSPLTSSCGIDVIIFTLGSQCDKKRPTEQNRKTSSLSFGPCNPTYVFVLGLPRTPASFFFFFGSSAQFPLWRWNQWLRHLVSSEKSRLIAPSQNCFCDLGIGLNSKFRCSRIGRNSSKAICFTSAFQHRVGLSRALLSQGSEPGTAHMHLPGACGHRTVHLICTTYFKRPCEVCIAGVVYQIQEAISYIMGIIILCSTIELWHFIFT